GPFLTKEELSCLQVLARIKKAMEQEIASLACLADSDIGYHLGSLYKKKLVIYENQFHLTNRKYLFPQWRLSRDGLLVALRSWGVPKGIEFSARYEEHSHLIGTKH